MLFDIFILFNYYSIGQKLCIININSNKLYAKEIFIACNDANNLLCSTTTNYINITNIITIVGITSQRKGIQTNVFGK